MATSIVGKNIRNARPAVCSKIAFFLALGALPYWVQTSRFCTKRLKAFDDYAKEVLYVIRQVA